MTRAKDLTNPPAAGKSPDAVRKFAVCGVAALAQPRSGRRTLTLLGAAAAALVLCQTHYFGLTGERARWLSGLAGLVPSACAIWIASRCPAGEPPVAFVRRLRVLAGSRGLRGFSPDPSRS